MIKNYFRQLLAEFKWYRRRKGGTWYLAVDPFAGGMQGTLTRWTQEPEPDWQIIKEERY